MPTANALALQESRSWCRHFLAKATAPDRLPWNDPTPLSRDEFQCIQNSIQQFQLGEGSSGRRLLQRGLDYSRAAGDPDFVDALQLFVKEEQRHSAHLLRFMEREGIAAVSSHWVDTIFRRLRVLAGLELSLRVLVSAEIIAVPYYQALGAATQSPLLQAISARILHDEAAQLRFQASMLSRLTASRTLFADRIVSALQRLFLVATCYVVWFNHRSVFHAAGYSRQGFLAESLWEFYRLDNAVGCGLARAHIPTKRDEKYSGLVGANGARAKSRG